MAKEKQERKRVKVKLKDGVNHTHHGRPCDNSATIECTPRAARWLEKRGRGTVVDKTPATDGAG